MSNNVKHRSATKGVTISLGIASAVGDLVSPIETNAKRADALVSVCPECAEPHKVSQFYHCKENDEHGPFTTGELAKAKDKDGVLVRLSAAQVDSAKKSELPANHLDLRVHNRDEVQSKTVPSGASYVFRPSEAGDPRLYGVFLDFLTHNQDYVLMGVINIRGLDKLMRLDRGMNNQLMLVELTWPEELREFDLPEYEHNAELLGMAETLVASSVSEFDLGNYKKQARDRMNLLVEMVEQGQDVPVEPKSKQTVGADDLKKMLEAAIATAKG